MVKFEMRGIDINDPKAQSLICFAEEADIHYEIHEIEVIFLISEKNKTMQSLLIQISTYKK